MTPRRILLDERSPGVVRARIGALLGRATAAAFAVGRIRLHALDLTVEEVDRVARCRVLLGHLEAGTLLDGLERRDAAAAGRLEVLLGFARSGRLEIRSAGMGGWTPDFSIYRFGPEGADAGASRATVGLLGAHYFGAPHPVAGPSFTVELSGAAAAALLTERFEELWGLGHDVLPAIDEVLERAHALALDAAGRAGRDDRAGALP